MVCRKLKDEVVAGAVLSWTTVFEISVSAVDDERKLNALGAGVGAIVLDVSATSPPLFKNENADGAAGSAGVEEENEFKKLNALDASDAGAGDALVASSLVVFFAGALPFNSSPPNMINLIF